MTFRYIGNADIVHLNTRKEGAEDDKVLAVDLKLKVKIGLIGAKQFDERLPNFTHNEIGAVYNEMLGPIPFTHELEHFRLYVAGSHFSGVKLRKFVLEPIDGGQYVVTFIASFTPSGDEVAIIAEHLQEEIEIGVESESDDLPFGGESFEIINRAGQVLAKGGR